MKIKASYIDVLMIVATLVSGLINTRICEVMFCIMFSFILLHVTFSRDKFKDLRNWLLEVHEND